MGTTLRHRRYRPGRVGMSYVAECPFEDCGQGGTGHNLLAMAREYRIWKCQGCNRIFADTVDDRKV